ncbi:MAG: SAM-dependent chlorinase/fluorinase [Candidatus Omnitrophica bacterium]|nr:SAM-dependent chlorinase/fluorinase [Candidatus Omnitrophota bacterium]
MKFRPITLLTDFGLKDEYVGVMKGVILGLNPKARVIDLSHEVSPGDVRRAAWLLRWSWRYFPKGTIHAAVVDPGVGSRRKILCAAHGGHLFLAPDNGLLSGILSDVRDPKIFEVSNRRYALKPIGRTFQGRDIFAPAAAHLSKGLAPSRLGPRVRRIVRLDSPQPRWEGLRRLKGEVIYLDRFGSAVTNLPVSLIRRLEGKGSLKIRAKGARAHGLQPSYGAVPRGAALAVIGSRGFLEIAINRGSAAKRFGLRVGDKVEATAHRRHL